MGGPSPRSISILGRLQANPRDEGAWHAFVDRYGPVIQGWCRKYRIDGQDADDVGAIIFKKLLETALRRQGQETDGEPPRPSPFDPVRGIRALLDVMTAHAVSELFADRRRLGRLANDDELERALLDRAEGDLRQGIVLEYQLELLERAEQLVRLHVEERTWLAYWLTCREQLTTQEAAARIGVEVSAVYVSRMRVRQRLVAEIHRMEEDEGGPVDPPA